MVHAVMEHIQPGEVLVLPMPAPAPVALVGELLATQAKVRGAAAILINADGAVCVERERLGEVVKNAEARRSRETELRARLNAGELSFDIHGLRAFVAQNST